MEGESNNTSNINNGEVLEVEYIVTNNLSPVSTWFHQMNDNDALNDEIISSDNVSFNQQETSCPAPFYSPDNIYYSNITNSSQLFNSKENLFISEIKELKENVLNILLEKSNYDDDEYNDIDYENKEIDDFCNDIDKYNNEFKVIQEELGRADESLKKEIAIVDSNLKKIDYFIDFIEKLNDIDLEDKNHLIQNIKNLSKKLSNTETFTKAKKYYVLQRKKLLKYIYLFKKINKWNVANICTICLGKPVDHFIDPCGHTFCKGCLESHFKLKDINDLRIFSKRNNYRCPVCREGPIISAKPLYFL